MIKDRLAHDIDMLLNATQLFEDAIKRVEGDLNDTHKALQKLALMKSTAKPSKFADLLLQEANYNKMVGDSLERLTANDFHVHAVDCGYLISYENEEEEEDKTKGSEDCRGCKLNGTVCNTDDGEDCEEEDV